MAAKIKDGLFIGDAETSQSEVFINDNKISNLINLAGREVQNIWSSHGLVYLTYYWEDRPDYKLFVNHEDTLLTDLVEFIDVSINHGISVLLFSRRGTGRCVIAACLYLMMKYRWGFEKTYDYVYSKKPDIELNKGFIQQMFALDMKLLAARQKAFAIRNGIESGFKIEANMTIADIAAMLPSMEAKRWNAWDTDYLIEGNSESEEGEDAKLERKGSNSSSDFKSDRFRRSLNNSSGRNLLSGSGKLKFEMQRPEDAAEELVLIYSFINSKNTINALPGPYRNVYDTPKQFKLKFDAVPQEEDIHMFPTSPPRYHYSTRSILKGSASNLAAQAKSKLQIQQQQQQQQLLESEKLSSSGVVVSRKEQAALESMQPMYVIHNARFPSTGPVVTSNGSSGSGVGGSTAPKELRRVNSAGGEEFDQLYANQPKAGPRNSLDGSIAEAKTSAPGVNKQQQPQQQSHRSNDLYGFVGMTSDSRYSEAKNSSSGSAAADAANNQLTAEDRLRNLMADMQRQAYYKDGDGRVTASSAAPHSGHHHPNHASAAAANAGPSLYDLANMNYHPPAPAAAVASAAPRGYDDDPLSAFEMLQQQNAKMQSSNQLNSSSGGGAVRARHDIVSGNNSYLNSGRGQPVIPSAPRPPVKNAWAPIDSNTSNTAASNTAAYSRGVNPATGRPLSASNGPSSSSSGRAPSPTMGRQPPQQSSNSSVASVNSGLSSITQQQQPVQSVGAGTTSSSRVYRHGSPAPNNRTSKPVASSGYGASNSSVGSSNSLRPSQPARAPSPIGGLSSSRDPSSSANNNNAYSTPQRRLSNSSFTSFGSSGPVPSTSSATQQQPDRRRFVGSSPLRASTGSSSGGQGAVNSGGGVTSKRYSTPTPQSQQHNEYDSAGLSSSLRGNTAVRSATPTKNTWRF